MFRIRYILFLNFVVLVLVIMSLKFKAQRVNAQVTSPFLSSPYYDTKTITSHFDHELPNYVENNIFTRYDGIRWTDPPTPVDVINCDTGINCYDGHDGIDFGGFDSGSQTNNYYEPVIAAASGYVTRSEWYDMNNRFSSYGMVIEISHSNGYVTRYGHLSSITVEQDQFVTAGQIIGTAGNTGNSGAVHLHFGVLNANNQPVDPFGWSGNNPDPWTESSGATSDFLWSDGEWAGSPIPSPSYVDTIWIDNGDFGFSKGCENANYWWYVPDGGFFGDMTYTFVGPYGNCYATWQPTLPVSGFYDVEVHVPWHHATSWQVDFRVRGSDNVLHHTKVDQLEPSNTWLSLGTYPFTAGSNPFHNVWLDDYTGEADFSRKIGADALRFRRRDSDYVYLPLIIK